MITGMIFLKMVNESNMKSFENLINLYNSDFVCNVKEQDQNSEKV